MLLLILVSVFTVLIALDFYMTKISRFGRLLEKIPGPKGYPVIGIMHLLVNKSLVELFYQNREWCNTYKNIYKLRGGPFAIVTVNHPDDIEVILKSKTHIKKDFVYDLFHPWLRDGLLVTSGAKWHRRRKLLSPAFHSSILKDSCKIFQEQGLAFVESLKSNVGSEIDVIPPVTEYTLYSLTESTMGLKLEDAAKKIAQYRKNVDDMGKYIIYRMVRLWCHSFLIFSFSKIGQLQKKAIIELHKFTKSVINERRINGNSIQLEGDEYKFSENGDESKLGESGNINSTKRLAMLDLMLSMENKGEIDDQGVQEEVDTFMFGGYDTTSSAITFLLMNLANSPEVQERVVEELQEVLYDPDEKATMEDLSKMSYLECCIKESLRLYPSIPYFSRQLTEDVMLSNYLIPKGSGVSFHPYDVHRNPEFFPNPSKFDPERFFPENSVGRHPFSYIPFSGGPRNCIGQKFAMLEMKSIISTVLRKYTLLPVTKPTDVIFKAEVVLKARDPVKVKFVLRKDPF